ncbi:MAG: hypothetical protein ACI4JJ_05540 [Huintestinicola sp.]
MNELMIEHEFSKWFEDVPSCQTDGLPKLRDDAPESVRKEAIEYDNYFFERTGRHKIYFGK